MQYNHVFQKLLKERRHYIPIMQWKTVTFAAVLLQILMTTSTYPTLEETVSSDIRESNIDYRLRTNVKPTHYKITLDPLIVGRGSREEPVPDTFTGEVIIRVKVLEETESITLHYNDLTVHDVSIKRAGNETDLPVTHTYNNVTHFWVISLDTSADDDAEGTFKANEEYLITTDYTGRHQDDMYGFYRSSYRDTENNTM
jgi:aminopeptidase N